MIDDFDGYLHPPVALWENLKTLKNKKMTAKEFRNVRETVESEGSVEYTFVHYSDFQEIDDAEFHKLRKAFVDAYQALYDYLDLDQIQ